MKKNIFQTYASEEKQTLTVESSVSIVDALLGEISYQEALVAADELQEASELVLTTESAIKKYEVAVAGATSEEGEVLTVESAVKVVGAYEALISDLNMTDKDLETIGVEAPLTVESASSSPESATTLTTENAAKVLKAAGDAIVATIKAIIAKIKAQGTKIIAGMMTTEKNAAELKKYVDEETTQELKAGAEVDPTKLAQMFGVAGEYTGDAIIKMMAYSNDSSVLGDIVKGITDAVASNDAEDFYAVIKSAEFGADKAFKDSDDGKFVSALPIDVTADKLTALVVREKDGKKSLKVEKADADTSKFKNAKPLSKAEITKVLGEIVTYSKKQKDYIANVSKQIEDVSKIKLDKVDEKFVSELKSIINTVSNTFVRITFGAANSCRLAITGVSMSATHYEKKSDEAK